jgi:hypothetical protein
MNDSPAQTAIQFHCSLKYGGCGWRFESSVYRNAPYPEREWHPWRHLADCPHCGEEAEQASQQVASWKAAQVGKSASVRAKISEANKARDPASYAVSRFNALTHGMSAETAKFYPARPGKYDQCDGCEFLNDGCGTSVLKHCAKRTELFVQFNLAMEEGNSGMLGRLMASNQAALHALLGDMMRAVAKRGVELESPEFSFNKLTGGIDLAEWEDAQGNKHVITKVEAHPLLPHIINYFHKNGSTLADLSLTPAAAKEEERLQGFLDDQQQSRESLADAQQAMQRQLAGLQRIIGGQGRMIEGGRVIDAEDNSDD